MKISHRTKKVPTQAHKFHTIFPNAEFSLNRKDSQIVGKHKTETVALNKKYNKSWTENPYRYTFQRGTKNRLDGSKLLSIKRFFM